MFHRVGGARLDATTRSKIKDTKVDFTNFPTPPAHASARATPEIHAGPNGPRLPLSWQEPSRVRCIISVFCRERAEVRACQVAYLSAARRLVSPLAPQKLCVGAMHASADIGPVIAGPAEALAMPPSSMKSGRRWSRSAR